MSTEEDVGRVFERMGDLPEFKDGYWSRRVAVTGVTRELAGLEARRGDVEPRDQQFLRFAKCVAAAYDGLDDKEIAQAKETPELMRYLKRALGEYAKNVTEHLEEHEKIVTPKRYEILANALLASGDRGGKRGWTQNRIETAINAYRGFLYDNTGWDNHDKPEWQAQAFEAAYEAVFGDKVVGDSQLNRNRAELERELVKHGGLNPLIRKKARRIKLT